MYLIEDAEILRQDVWAGKIPQMYLAHLADGLTPMAAYSVVTGAIKLSGSDLMFSPATAQLLCKGFSEDALFINTASNSEDAEPKTDSTRGQPHGNGDQGFLDAAMELVGSEFAELGKALVNGFRQTNPGKLVERQGRKWLNAPENFVAITIQNRDRSFAVSIRQVREAEDSSLRPRADRPGYLRFKVAHLTDVPEAARLILASARRG